MKNQEVINGLLSLRNEAERQVLHEQLHYRRYIQIVRALARVEMIFEDTTPIGRPKASFKREKKGE